MPLSLMDAVEAALLLSVGADKRVQRVFFSH